MKIVWVLITIANCCGNGDATIVGLWGRVPTEAQCMAQGAEWMLSGEHRGFMCLKRKIVK